MNYKSQLKGWAIDRAIEIHKGQSASFDQIMATADKLLEYCYIADEDFHGTAKLLIGMAPDVELENLDHVIAALQVVQEQKANKQ